MTERKLARARARESKRSSEHTGIREACNFALKIDHTRPNVAIEGGIARESSHARERFDHLID